MEELKSEIGQFKDQISAAEGKAIQAEQQVRQAGEILAVERQQATAHIAEARQQARQAEEMLAKERSILATRIDQLEERITTEACPEPRRTPDIPFSNPLPSESWIQPPEPTHSETGIQNFVMELDLEESGHAASQGQAPRSISANPSGSRNTQAVRSLYCARIC